MTLPPPQIENYPSLDSQTSDVGNAPDLNNMAECVVCLPPPPNSHSRNEIPALRVVLPIDVIDFDSQAEDDLSSLVVIGTSSRDSKVTKIAGLETQKKLLNLQEVILRSCLISKIEGLKHLAGSLTKLELYDNQIDEVDMDCLTSLHSLRILDLSFNALRSMDFLAECNFVQLEELYLAQNKLRKIEGLEGKTSLKVLDLGANRIRVIEGISSCTSLKSLWLGKNKIEELAGLEGLTCLEQLDVQNNRLTSLGRCLRDMHRLRELYLACNAIKSLGPQGQDLPSHEATQLTTLDLSSNGLGSIEGIESQQRLQELWISSSELSSFAALEPLCRLPLLNCVYLEHSPIAKDFEYRKRLTVMIPTLEQLDATTVHRL